MSRVREIEVTNTAGLQINPATEETLVETNARLGDNITNPGVTSIAGRLKSIFTSLTVGGIIANSLTQKERKVRDGDMYFVSHSEKVKKKKKFRVVFQTPAAPQEIYFNRNSAIITSKESTIKVYIGMTTTGTLGDPVPVLNANGNSSNVSPVNVFINPTGTINPGTLAFSEIVDEDSRSVSAFNKSDIIFKYSMNYMMEIESKKDSNIVTLPFEFFVHTP